MSVLYPSYDEEDDSTDYEMEQLYQTYSNPHAVVPYMRKNAQDKADRELSWEETFDAAWGGIKHGVTTHGPEQFYRMTRALARLAGNVVDTSDLQDWATRGIEENHRARETDPWYRPDPKWMESAWGRSFYEGFSNATVGLMAFLPAAGAVVGAGATLGAGALFFSGLSFLTGSGAQAAMGGLATFDSFLDDAYREAQRSDPTVTRETIESDKFWAAVTAGVSDAGTNFVGDMAAGKILGPALRAAGGKLVGKSGQGIVAALSQLMNEDAAKNVSGVVGKYVKNITNAVAINMGEGAANAAIQDWLREANDMDHQGRIEAILNMLGPSAVSGAASGVRNSLFPLPMNRKPLSLEESQAKLRESEMLRRTASLSPEAAELMGKANLNMTDNGDSAFNKALVVDALAKRASLASGESPETFIMSINPQDADLGAFLSTLGDPSKGLADTVESSTPFLFSRLDDGTQQALRTAFPSEDGQVDRTGLAGSLIQALKGGDSVVDGMPISDTARDGVRAMRDVFSDAAYALDSNSMVRGKVSRETVDALKENGTWADRRDASAAAVAFDGRGMSEVMTRWEGQDISSPESRKEFLRDAFQAIDLDNLNGISAPDNPVDIFKQYYKASKPIQERLKTHPSPQSDAMTEARAKSLLADNPGWQVAVDAITSVEGLGGKVAAVAETLSLMKEHLGDIAVMARDKGQFDPLLGFRAILLNANYLALNDGHDFSFSEIGRALRRARFDKQDPKFVEKASTLAKSVRGSEEAQYAALVALANASEAGKTDLANHAMRIPLRARTMDAVVEYVTSGLLFGPSTHVVNTSVNAGMLVSKLMQTAYAEFLTPQQPGGVFTGETMGMIHGFWSGLKQVRDTWKTHRSQYEDGVSGWTKAVRDSDSLWPNAEQMGRAISSQNFGLSSEHGRASGGLATMVDIIGKAMSLPYKALLHEDQVFKTIAQAGIENALIIRRAQGDLDKQKSWFTNVPSDIKSEARTMAAEMNFQGDYGTIAQSLNKVRINHPWTRLFIPFLKTPVNIFNEAKNMTPFASQLWGETGRALKSGDAAARQIAEAKVMLGTLIWTTGLMAAANGYLTGPGPWKDDERKKWAAAGRQPNSIHIGDTYYRIDRFDPFGLILNAAAFVVEAGEYMDGEDLTSAFTTGIGQAALLVGNRSYISSVADILALFTDTEHAAPDVIKRLGAMVVPASGLMRTINRDDGFQREVASFWDNLQNNIPGMSESLPVRRDFLGQPVENATHAESFLGYFSPVRTTRDKGDPVYDEVLRLTHAGHSAAPLPGRRIQHQGMSAKMDAREYSDFLDLYGNRTIINGRSAYQELRSVVSSAAYANMSDEQKAKHIKVTMSRYGRAAKEAMIQGSSRLQRQLAVKQRGWEYLIGNAR